MNVNILRQNMNKEDAKKYHIIVIGCQMNKSDSERITTYLEALGYIKTSDKYGAHLVIMITCGIRQSAEDRLYGFIPRIKKENPTCKLVVTGCLSKRKDVIIRMREYVDIWLPITELFELAEKLGETYKIESYKEYLNIKPNYTSKISAYIPIGNGCDNFCSYCVVPYARGREKYRNSEDIFIEVKDLIEKGYKEINLIAQNVNSYSSCNKSKDKVDFADLLKMVNEIPGDFWIRFATSHPKDMSDKLIDTIVSCEKVCEHVHLPAQSGNNEVLQNMNRKYTVEHYRSLIDKIRSKISGVAITTDIIVGFPGESYEQFMDTCRLFEYANFDMAYISKYSPRPGTVALKFDDNVSSDEKKIRENKLMGILKDSAQKNSKLLLKKNIKVLVEGKNKRGEFYGKTRTSKNVKFFDTNDNKIGKIADVVVDKVDCFVVRARVEQEKCVNVPSA